MPLKMNVFSRLYEEGAESLSTEIFRLIEYSFAARLLIQLINPKLFEFKHEISILVST